MYKLEGDWSLRKKLIFWAIVIAVAIGVVFIPSHNSTEDHFVSISSCEVILDDIEFRLNEIESLSCYCDYGARDSISFQVNNIRSDVDDIRAVTEHS